MGGGGEVMGLSVSRSMEGRWIVWQDIDRGESQKRGSSGQEEKKPVGTFSDGGEKRVLPGLIVGGKGRAVAKEGRTTQQTGKGVIIWFLLEGILKFTGRGEGTTSN